MTVEEKVGQIFLVTFVGNDPGPGTDVAQLIEQDHVGGVVLLAANSNFVNNDNTPRQVAELTNALQASAMGSESRTPLFIAIDHEGDGYPYTRITGGVTPLPNAMAIGATWQPGNARKVGQITGLELAAMGVNLLLGPVVDVLHNPNPSGQGDMGTRTFGGSPWWVGQMGQAYIEGVHQGSGGRVATVAKHFPGHGGSDRLPDEEVSTVDKSIEELQRVELAPFVAVTGGGGQPSSLGSTDALMSSHIRYRGLQDDVRQFTAPISFDPEGMAALLNLDGLRSWRSEGLMVSDSLGVPAVRKYFDPTLATFPHRRIAKEAFLAGNDLLLLAQFDLNNTWTDQFANIRDTIAFFRQEYQANPSFAARVDNAVSRSLRLKLRLYPEFELEAVQVHPDAAPQVSGLGTEVTQNIVAQALTLLYPDPNALPSPPKIGHEILIFTDARPVRECFTEACQPFAPLSQTAVEETLLRIYGPAGTGQVSAENLTSLPFGQLKKFIAGAESEYDIGTLLTGADWILFATQDLNLVRGPNSDAVKLFLDHPSSSIANGKLVVLAFNGPYYLDTTEISKLDLYLGAYSKTPPAIEAAVRALFGELVPTGAPPVNVEGINYDLSRQLEPDPEQTIPLLKLEPQGNSIFQPPISVRLRAGPILDHNKNPVRDETVTTFYAEYADGTYALPRSSSLANGQAETTFELDRSGLVQFRVESGNAKVSEIVNLELQAAPTASPVPSSTPSPQPTESPTQVPKASPTAVPSPTPAPLPIPAPVDPSPPADGIDFLLSAGVTVLVAFAGFLLFGLRTKRRMAIIRWVLVIVIGGMIGYCLYAAHLIRPDSWQILSRLSLGTRAGAVILSGAGALIGLVLARSTAGRQAP